MEKVPGVEGYRTSNPPLLIFGQGPVIDKLTRSLAQEGVDAQGDEDVNFWSKNLALAAVQLYERGQVPEIAVMGGRTGGKQYKSEAELIKLYLKVAGVPENIVTTEEESTDTIANLINLINTRDSQGYQRGEKYQILGSPQHISRIQILMQLFKISFSTGQVYSSDEVLRFAARDKPDWEGDPQTHKDLAEVERRLDLKDNNLYYQRQQGLEKRDYADRLTFDDILSRELLEFPESWLGRAADIENSARLMEILEQVDKLWPQVLQTKFGINRELDASERIREKLAQIQKKPLSPETIKQWAEESETIGWPKEVQDRLNMLIQERRKRN